ncbi:MAG: class F sortase [Actinomycetota bacterium]|nr:class F sortase [Actinomycetota bacterium]MDQ2958441.1 class F sortase [Actinomycetota bacterium]
MPASRTERVEVLVFGIIALIAALGAGLAWHQFNRPALGDIPLPPTTPTTAAGVSRPVAGPRNPKKPAGPAAVRVPAGFAHDTLAIPGQSVTASIQAQVVDVAGYLGVPANVRVVGYYTGGGTLDGRVGDLLVTGHVNYVGQGTGALGRIGQLKVGDPVITRGAGAAQGWRITALASYPKSTGLPAAIFRATGRRALTLITCGGVLDRQAGNYLSNIVVTAMPAPTVTG